MATVAQARRRSAPLSLARPAAAAAAAAAAPAGENFQPPFQHQTEWFEQVYSTLAANERPHVSHRDQPRSQTGGSTPRHGKSGKKPGSSSSSSSAFGRTTATPAVLSASAVADLDAFGEPRILDGEAGMAYHPQTGFAAVPGQSAAVLEDLTKLPRDHIWPLNAWKSVSSVMGWPRQKVKRASQTGRGITSHLNKIGQVLDGPVPGSNSTPSLSSVSTNWGQFSTSRRGSQTVSDISSGVRAPARDEASDQMETTVQSPSLRPHRHNSMLSVDTREGSYSSSRSPVIQSKPLSIAPTLSTSSLSSSSVGCPGTPGIAPVPRVRAQSLSAVAPKPQADSYISEPCLEHATSLLCSSPSIGTLHSHSLGSTARRKPGGGLRHLWSSTASMLALQSPPPIKFSCPPSQVLLLSLDKAACEQQSDLGHSAQHDLLSDVEMLNSPLKPSMALEAELPDDLLSAIESVRLEAMTTPLKKPIEREDVLEREEHENKLRQELKSQWPELEAALAPSLQARRLERERVNVIYGQAELARLQQLSMHLLAQERKGRVVEPVQPAADAAQLQTSKKPSQRTAIKAVKADQSNKENQVARFTAKPMPPPVVKAAENVETAADDDASWITDDDPSRANSRANSRCPTRVGTPERSILQAQK